MLEARGCSRMNRPAWLHEAGQLSTAASLVCTGMAVRLGRLEGYGNSCSQTPVRITHVILSENYWSPSGPNLVGGERCTVDDGGASASRSAMQPASKGIMGFSTMLLWLLSHEINEAHLDMLSIKLGPSCTHRRYCVRQADCQLLRA